MTLYQQIIFKLTLYFIIESSSKVNSKHHKVNQQQQQQQQSIQPHATYFKIYWPALSVLRNQFTACNYRLKHAIYTFINWPIITVIVQEDLEVQLYGQKLNQNHQCYSYISTLMVLIFC
jgi:hypothetical protein